MSGDLERSELSALGRLWPMAALADRLNLGAPRGTHIEQAQSGESPPDMLTTSVLTSETLELPS